MMPIKVYFETEEVKDLYHEKFSVYGKFCLHLQNNVPIPRVSKKT